MKVLITSGGTKIPIDGVRSITNMSNGTFGSRIAETFIRHSVADIHFIKAKRSEAPFQVSMDIREATFSSALAIIEDKLSLLEKLKNSRIGRKYTETTYVTFEDYSDLVLGTIKKESPDVIILSAAVSDYGTKPVDGKIRSKNALTIELEPLPKIISQIRSISPNSILVGFKLLVDSTKQELFTAAAESIKKNGCDIVIANDWADLRNGKHDIMIVNKVAVETGIGFLYPYKNDDRMFSARKVFDAIMMEYEKKCVQLFGGV